MRKLKSAMKRWIGRIFSVELLEKLTEYAIAEQGRSVSVRHLEPISVPGSSWQEIVPAGREKVWSATFDLVPGPDILLLEFGVWQGESMRFFSNRNKSGNSRFYGFDSFEGLPEAWRGMSTEHFNVNGQIPDIRDDRVEFVKGWFQDTLPGKLEELSSQGEGKSVVINFDADLYSSTLYLLFQIGSVFKEYYFFFDEYSGHEQRALFNYIQATGAKCEFYHRLDWEGWPGVVSGKLTAA